MPSKERKKGFRDILTNLLESILEKKICLEITEILMLGKTSWWSQIQCWRADIPNVGNHHLKWNPCGNPCVEAKNKGWRINSTVGHNNQDCDGKAKCTETLPKQVYKTKGMTLGLVLLQLKSTNPPKPRKILSMTESWLTKKED